MRLCIDRNYRIIKPLFMSAIVLGGKAQEAIPNENFQPAFLHPTPTWHHQGTWMASQIVVLSVLGQDPFLYPGSRFTVSINQGSPSKVSLFFCSLHLDSLGREKIAPQWNDLWFSTMWFFTLEVVLGTLLIGQIKVVRSCQLKRDLPALEHSLLQR